MPFNPIIDNIGSALIARGYSGAADSKLAGDAALAQGIASAGSSIGGAVAGAAQKMQQDAKQSDTNAGVLSSYHALNERAKQDTGQGIMPDSFFEALAATKNKDQQSGMLMSAAPNFDSFLTQQRQMKYLEAQTNASANLAAFKETLPQPQTSKRAQVITGQNGVFTLDENGVAQPVKDAQGNPVIPRVPTDPVMTMFSGGSQQPTAVVSAPYSATSSAYSEGQKAKNAAGEIVIFKGGKWERL